MQEESKVTLKEENKFVDNVFLFDLGRNYIATNFKQTHQAENLVHLILFRNYQFIVLH